MKHRFLLSADKINNIASTGFKTGLPVFEENLRKGGISEVDSFRINKIQKDIYIDEAYKIIVDQLNINVK